MLEFLDSTLKPEHRTIETGAGISTILFLMKGIQHTCIVPDKKQIDRIQSYCQAKGISLEQAEFIQEPSEVALPRLTSRRYDLALIDGGHGFPLPFLDWYYVASILKVGGYIVVDDLHIWTCDTLIRFLYDDPAWSCVIENSRAAVFQKKSEDYRREWNKQGFVVRQSRATSLTSKVGYIARLLHQGNITLLKENVFQRITGRS